MNSNGFVVLSKSKAVEAGLEWPDFYFSPEYGYVSEIQEGGEWFAALWLNGDAIEICLPFIVRPIISGRCAGLSDVISPYGYSGLFVSPNCSEDSLTLFRVRLREYYKEVGVVSEFLRQSGLLKRRFDFLCAGFEGVHTESNPTIAINVGVDYEEAWSNYEGRARTKVRKAVKNGFVASNRQLCRADVASSSPFVRLYLETMLRLSAAKYYNFSEEYFERLYEYSGRFAWIQEVSDAQGNVVWSGIYFLYREWVHLHLVGGDPSVMKFGVGNFGYDGLVRWACDVRCARWLHVGGGVSGEDSLFGFKKSFGGVRKPFSIYREVLDSEAYDELTREAGFTEEENDFFPSYRSRQG